MAYALYTEYGPLHLDPCPLCIFQRVAMITLGVVFAVAALHAPLGAGARVYAVLGGLVAATGLSISSWHVHVQNLPPDQVPTCGPGLDYMWEALLGVVGWERIGRNRFLKLLFIPFRLEAAPAAKTAWYGKPAAHTRERVARGLDIKAW